AAFTGDYQKLKSGNVDYAKRAQALPYASLKLSVSGRTGLLVMAERAGRTAYFQAPGAETLVLRNDRLSRFVTPNWDLLLNVMGQRSAGNTKAPWHALPVGDAMTYTVMRQWRSEDGRQHADQPQARLVCNAGTTDVELPLATVALQQCTETLHWSNGERTRTTLWRDVDEYRVWQVHTVPWPGGPRIEWQVARPWW